MATRSLPHNKISKCNKTLVQPNSVSAFGTMKWQGFITLCHVMDGTHRNINVPR